MEKRYLLWLLIIVVLGSVLRMWNAGAHGIWFDEKCSVLEANGISSSALSGMAEFHNSDVKELSLMKNVIAANLSRDGGNGILYAMTLHVWVKIFGSADFSIRLLSILFGIALIILAWRFAIQFTGNKKFGLLVALLIAVHPLLIAYSQQARGYSMATFFAFAASYFFFSILFRGTLSRSFFFYAGYAVCVIATLLSHYQSASVFLGHGLIALLFLREKKKWLNVFLVFAVVIACMMAWYYNGGREGLKVIAARNESYKTMTKLSEEANPFLLPASPKNIITGWLQVLLHMSGNALQWLNLQIRFIGPLLLIPLLLLLAAMRNHRKVGGGKIIPSLFILFLFAPVYATVLAILSGHIISFQPLYSIFAVPYLIILLAAGFIFQQDAAQKSKRAIAWTAGISLLVIMVISLIPVLKGTYINPTAVRRPNPYIQVAGELSKSAAPGDTIIFPSLVDAQLTNIYMITSSQVNQKVDTTDAGKFFIVRKNGTRVEIEDFKSNNLYY